MQRDEVLQLLGHALWGAVEEQHVASSVLGHVTDGLGPHREQDECRIDVLVLELARRLPLEIVNADSVQVFRGMDVGSAKPSAAERAKVTELLKITPRDELYRDLFWALLNSKEFLFNR